MNKHLSELHNRGRAIPNKIYTDDNGDLYKGTALGRLGRYFKGSDTSSLISYTSLSAYTPLVYNSTTGQFSIPVATSTVSGYLSYTDWNTFNNKGTVTSVAMSVPTGLSISGTPITTSGTLAITFTSGYSIPTTASQTNWDTAYTNRITSLTVTGSSGAATLSSNTLNIPTYTATGLGAVPTTRTLTINSTAYDLSANRSWTIAGGLSAYAAGGTVNAITASPSMTFSSGNTCAIICTGYNTVTTPTLATDGNAAKTITTRGGLPLQIGDITASTHIFEYTGTTFELLNPASEVPSIQNTITFVEDFNRAFSTTGFVVSASGAGAAGYTGSTFGKGNGAGWYGVRTGTTTTGRALCYCTPTSNEYFQLGNGLTIIEISSWTQRNGVLSSGSDTFISIAGMGTTLNSSTQSSGVYVEYDTATDATYWITTCSNNGTRTRTSSTFALPSATTDYFSFMIIVNAAGTSVDFYGRKNGGTWTLMNTMTTNIPANATTAQIFPLWGVFKTAGTNEGINSIDAISWKTILTTPR